MKPEELLQQLRDGGMDDEAIKGLLTEAIAVLEPAPEEAGMVSPEDEEAKADKIFGAI